MNSTSTHLFAVLPWLALSLACSRGPESGGSTEQSPAPAGAENLKGPAGEASGAKVEAEKKRPGLFGSRIPVGPRLVIQPGKSVGPIFFGATRETIERLMQAPCDISTADQCIYIKQALVFTLKDGVLVRAKANLRDRRVPSTEKEAVFGTFHGGMAPEILLGLHRHVVLEEFGKPQRQEDIPLNGETGLVARHFYDGLILEYDTIDNGNVVLAAFEVFPHAPAEEASAAQGRAQSAPAPTPTNPAVKAPAKAQ